MAHEIKNKFLYQAVTSVTQILLPLISYPYITRVLGPANLGKVNYVDFLVQMFMIFAAFGVPFYGVREIARVRDDKIKRSILVKELTILLFLFSIIASAVFIVLTFGEWKNNRLLYSLGIVNLFISTFSYDWYMQGTEAFRFVAIRSLIIRLIMLALFFIFIKTSADYPLYYAIFSGALLINAVINILKLLKENAFIKQPPDYRRHIKPLCHFFFTSSAISIYVYFDTIILKHITHSDEAVGIYNLPLRIIKLGQMILITAGTVMLPRLSYLAGADNFDGAKKYLAKLFDLVITAGLPLCAGMFLLAPEIIQVIAGEQFLPSVNVLRILSFLPLLFAVGNLFSFQVLVPFKKDKQLLAAFLAGCIVSVSLNFLLIPLLSESGAAYTNVATEIFIVVRTGIYAFRIVHFSINIKMVLRCVLSALLFIPVIFILRHLFTSPLLVLGLSIALCSILYLCLQWFVFKNTVAIEMQKYLKSILSTKRL